MSKRLTPSCSSPWELAIDEGVPRRSSTPVKSAGLALWVLVAIVVLGSLAFSPNVAAEQAVLDLGTLRGDLHSGAVKINEAGQVIGWSGRDAGYGLLHAFLWHNDVMTDLGTLGGPHAEAYDINEGGQIVGVSVNASNLYQPFLWDGVMTQLDVGSSSAWGTAINDLGHVAGYRYVSDPDWGAVARAFLLKDGVLTDLGPLPGYDNSFATGMNNAGQVVGYARDSDMHPIVHAFLYDNGVMTDLGALPGDFNAGATDINEQGQIVGWSGQYELGPHAFLWENGSMKPLAPYDNGENPFGTHIAYGINDAEQVVGLNGTAVLWEDGTETTLETLAPGRAAIAKDLNEAGLIVGQASTASHETHAVLWAKPVSIHDVAVTANAQKPDPIVGETIPIVARAENQGNQIQTFEVTVGVGPYAVGTDTVTLGARTSTDIVFDWDTTGTEPGTYSLRATAGPVPGEADLDDNVFLGKDAITILARLSATASAEPSATDVGLQVLFTCDETDRVAPHGPYAFSWDFGDGNTTTGDRVTHSYASAGPKEATCTVTEESGDWAFSTATVEVFPRPSVNATADRTEASPGTPITFTATATGGSGTYTFNWGFGDGNSGTGPQVTHAYAKAGRYTVIVLVQDSFGGTGPNTVRILVDVTQVAVIAASSAAEALTGESITFTASALGGAGGPYRFAWDFLDGTTATGAIVTHAYDRPGTFTPRVTVMDGAGASRVHALEPIRVRGPSESVVPATTFGLPVDPLWVAGGILVGSAVIVLFAVTRDRRSRKP